MQRLLPLFVLMVISQMFVLPVRPVQGQSLKDPRDAPLSLSISYASINQFETDFEKEGRFDVSRQHLNIGVKGQLSEQVTVGLDLKFGIEDWEFTNLPTVAGATHWDKVHQHGISLPMFYAVDESWMLGMIPTVQFSGVSDAEVDDSLIYGGVVVLNYIYSRNLQLGVGFAAFSELEETLYAPFLLINWQINDQLRIANPLDAGPAGPAGLEIVYAPSVNWEFAVGGAYRSYRFRLSEDNAESNGIVENEGAVAFLRLQRKLGTMMALDVYGGAFFDGKLSIEDSEGGHISTEAYDPAPMVAVQLSCEF